MNTKDMVLKALEESRGKYVSGAELAGRLGISRTAVWKSISALIRDGVQIESLTGSGYMLPKEANTLSVQGIEKYLHSKELDIRIYKEVDSTNNVGKSLAADGAKEGTVVFALTQTGGKGRLGRKFYSPSEAGVYFSVIVRPSAAVVPYLTVLAAVAVAEGIENAGGKATQIKWVNDVFADGKKCCGILTEAVADLESGGVEYAVVGIGINVTEPKGGFAPEIRDVATSVCDGIDDARNKVAAEVLNSFFKYYKKFDKDEVTAIYKRKSFLIGKEITVVKSDSERTAIARDIDGDCHLTVEYKDGTRETLSSGEVSLKINH
ncbi:MAG: biotin--[acetyl-CoA-carboxylase] ligase [Clostridia bacterium]|nr:biotin--[acetyl-CoA-carboxylase] ligase [Clostridia bacterium]